MISESSVLIWTVLSLIPAMFLTIAIHELGHALTGALAGFRVVACGFGITQPLVHVRIWGVSFYIARPIFLGLTLAIPKQLRSDRRARSILLVGGVAANLVTGLIAWQFSRHGYDWKFLSVFAFLSIFVGITNLIPFYASKYRIPTDGLQILRCIRNQVTNDPAQAISSFDRIFKLCKSLEAHEGVAYYGRALALYCADMGDYETAEEILDDPTLFAPESNSPAIALDLLTRAVIAVAKKSANAEELLTKAELECMDDLLGVTLKLLRAQHMMNVGGNARALLEDVLGIARTTGQDALATKAEALLLSIESQEDTSRQIDRLLSLSSAQRLSPMMEVNLLVSQAKNDFMRGATDDAKERIGRAQRILTTTTQNIANLAIRARVLTVGLARLRQVLPLDEDTSFLDETVGQPIPKKSRGIFVRMMRGVLVGGLVLFILSLFFSVSKLKESISMDTETPMSAQRHLQMQEHVDTIIASIIEDQLNTLKGLRNSDKSDSIGTLETELASIVSHSQFMGTSKSRNASFMNALRDLREYRQKYPGAMADSHVDEILKDALSGDTVPDGTRK